MNLPFGITGVKESGKKREEEERSIAKYDRKLADYRDTLESFKNCVIEYTDRLENYDKKTYSNQMSSIQAALDITYIKEQGDKVVELMEGLQAGSINQIALGVDHLTTNVEKLDEKVKRYSSIIWCLLVFNVVGLGGLIFVILYIMKIIPLT